MRAPFNVWGVDRGMSRVNTFVTQFLSREEKRDQLQEYSASTYSATDSPHDFTPLSSALIFMGGAPR